MEGYLQLDRGFFDHFLWSQARTFSSAEAWLDLIQTAAFAQRVVLVGGQAITIKRGRIVASVRFLQARWKWSNSKVVSFLALLQGQGMIVKETIDMQAETPGKRRQITVIFLCKYEEYNSPKRQQSDEEKTAERHPGDEREEGQEGKIIPLPPGAKPAAPVDDSTLYDPMTKEQALAAAHLAGVPADFALFVFNSWLGRDCKDAGGVRVRFAQHVRSRWVNEEFEWENGTHNGKKKGNGKRTESCRQRDRTGIESTAGNKLKIC